MAAALSALLERRRLYLPDQGREVPVHDDFRIFGTRSLAVPAHASSSASGSGSHTAVPVPVAVPALRHFSFFWHVVTVNVPTSEEIRHIVAARFPALLPSVVDQLFATYGLFGDRPSPSPTATATATALAGGLQAPRPFTLRDLVKAARRCASHSGDFNVTSGLLTSELRRRLLSEVRHFEVTSKSLRSHALGSGGGQAGGSQAVNAVHEIGRASCRERVSSPV